MVIGIAGLVVPPGQMLLAVNEVAFAMDSTIFLDAAGQLFVRAGWGSGWGSCFLRSSRGNQVFTPV